MEIPTFTWFNLLIATLVLMFIYFVMRLLHEFLNRLAKRNFWLNGFKKGLYLLFNLYEIIVILILCSIFLFINPVLHGLILLALILFSFSHIRNYISGRLALLDENLSIGKRLNIGSAKGVIVKMGYLGLQLRTATGLRFVSYRQLFEEGYSLVAVEEIGGFYLFEIEATNIKSKVNHLEWLIDAFLMTPYIDPNRHPELTYTNSQKNILKARILIREDSNLDDFVQLIQGWGYKCLVKIEE